MIVVDTSAMVAVLSGEPEQSEFNGIIAAAPACCMSAGSYLEASIVLEARFGPEGAHSFWLYIHEADIEVVPVDRDQADVARRGWASFGKGRHPAALNFGDCFAYALAQARDAPLLFKGDDFARTDVQVA